MRFHFEIRFWLLWVLIFPLAGAEAASSTNAWSVRVWQSDDGLPNNIVTSLAQTPDGYIWVANASRLARFDGVNFEAFPIRSLLENNGHPMDYNSQKIVAVMCARDGALWVATDHGMFAALKNGMVQLCTNNLPNTYVEEMVEDQAGSLWVKNRGGNTVGRVMNGQLAQVPFVGNNRWMATDNQGRVWCVNSGDVGIYRKGEFAPVVRVAPNGSGRLTGDQAGGVWVCVGADLYHVTEGDRPVHCGRYKEPLGNTEPTAMLTDKEGAVWIGTSDSGLYRYDGEGFESIPVSHRQILSLMEDRDGNIWVGTGGGGLDRVQPRSVTLEGMESSLPFETVMSLCQDGHGVVWAATENGLLVCRTNGGWRTISAETNVWPGGKVSCVAADPSGTLWVGTHTHRLYSLHDGKFSAITATNGLLSRTMRALLPAANGDLWMAGTGPDGLQCLHDGELQRITLPPDVQMIHAMAQTTDGTVWMGTSRGVLMRVDNGVVTNATPPSEHPLSIRCLQSTADGSLWIGYAGGGLGLIKNGHYTRVNSSEGLYDDHVSQITPDDRGWLWLGGDRGIFRIKQQDVEDLAAGHIKQIASVHYGPGEGLAGLQANFGECPGVLRGHDGRLWMPMQTALVIINPESLPEDTKTPIVLLKQIKVDDKMVAQYGGLVKSGNYLDTAGPVNLRLPPDHRHLEFDFTALGFNSPENIRFQYKLLNFDNDWVDSGMERRADYSRLAAGSYQFLIRACNSGGAWSAPWAGLTFTVTPFFWQSGWFWLIVVVAFTSMVAAIVRLISFRQFRLKMQALERQSALDRERTRIARDIHDDIGNLLTQVTLLSSLTLRDKSEPEKTGEHVQQISSTVEQVTNSLDEIVWAVNPRNDTLPQLIDYIGQFAVDFLQTTGIRYRVDLPDHPPHRAVPADVRHNVFLVVKESLNNVARHSGASEVTLRVAMTKQGLEVTIQDNGRSFDPVTVNGAGNGLRNIRQRMDELGGRLEVESKPGFGTRITLNVPEWGNHGHNGYNGSKNNGHTHS